MDRPIARQGLRVVAKSLILIPAAGSLILLTGSGCSSFHHRGKVPPAPRAIRDGSGAGFNSEPSPLQSARGGVVQPVGPISSGSPYGPAGSYGGAPGGNEPSSAPLGEPAPGVGGEAPAAAGGGAPVGGEAPPKPF